MLAPASRRLIAPGSRKLRTVSSRAVALWHARAYDGKLDALYDLSGNGLHARLGSAVGADTNDPLRLQFSGEKYVYFPGVSGNYLSAPDSAALSITGDIDIRMKLALDDWSPGTEATPLSKYHQTGDQRSYAISVRTNGTLRLSWSSGGTAGTQVNVDSTASLPIGAFETSWIRGTLDVDNGAGGYVAAFYISPDGTTWTQLGDPVVGGSTTSIFDSTAVVSIGGFNNGIAGLTFGKVFRAQIYNGINGTKVFDFNAAELVEPYASVTDVHGNVITLNRSATGRKLAVVDRDMFLLGTDDYFEVADHPLLNFLGSDSFTVALLFREYGNNSSSYFILKASGGGASNVGYWLSGSGRFAVADGNGASVFQTDTTAIPDGVPVLLAGGVLQTKLFRQVASSSRATADGTTTTLVNTTPMRIGRLGSIFADYEFLGAGVFREPLSAESLVRLRGELLT